MLPSAVPYNATLQKTYYEVDTFKIIKYCYPRFGPITKKSVIFMLYFYSTVLYVHIVSIDTTHFNIFIQSVHRWCISHSIDP
jgi:hypothetical protein